MARGPSAGAGCRSAMAVGDRCPALWMAHGWQAACSSWAPSQGRRAAGAPGPLVGGGEAAAKSETESKKSKVKKESRGQCHPTGAGNGAGHGWSWIASVGASGRAFPPSLLSVTTTTTTTDPTDYEPPLCTEYGSVQFALYCAVRHALYDARAPPDHQSLCNYYVLYRPGRAGVLA